LHPGIATASSVIDSTAAIQESRTKTVVFDELRTTASANDESLP
jgi:hypothetical protein